MSNLKKILIDKKNCKSVWFMRQAGRYLPEFRKIRAKNKNFINLCLNSELSAEITLQPIQRYDVDSAIIFSDILMVPFALGQKVEFVNNHGPILSDFNLKLFWYGLKILIAVSTNDFPKNGFSHSFLSNFICLLVLIYFCIFKIKFSSSLSVGIKISSIK